MGIIRSTVVCRTGTGNSGTPPGDNAGGLTHCSFNLPSTPVRSLKRLSTLRQCRQFSTGMSALSAPYRPLFRVVAAAMLALLTLLNPAFGLCRVQNTSVSTQGRLCCPGPETDCAESQEEQGADDGQAHRDQADEDQKESGTCPNSSDCWGCGFGALMLHPEVVIETPRIAASLFSPLHENAVRLSLPPPDHPPRIICS